MTTQSDTLYLCDLPDPAYTPRALPYLGLGGSFQHCFCFSNGRFVAGTVSVKAVNDVTAAIEAGRGDIRASRTPCVVRREGCYPSVTDASVGL